MKGKKVINLEKKKLIINTAVCDSRNVIEETLKSYEEININTAFMLVSEKSKVLLSKYNININSADVIEVEEDANLVVQNGSYELNGSTSFYKPTVLLVNGSLNITNELEDRLENILFINVNGMLSYPSSLDGKLPPIKVNGSIECYPSDAIKLKSKVVIDDLFVLRAKENKYYAKNKVIISDELVNLDKLNELGITFITKKAIIKEELLEEAVNLFDESVKIKIIPKGYSYYEDRKLDSQFIKKHGNKIYTDGDLVIDNNYLDVLEKIEPLIVEETLYVTAKASKILAKKDIEYNKLEITKGETIEDRAFITIDRVLLNQNEDGLRVQDAGIVKISKDLSIERIINELELVDCGIVNCSEEQKSAVEMISKNVGIIKEFEGKIHGIKDVFENLGSFKDDTKIINTSSYIL